MTEEMIQSWLLWLGAEVADPNCTRDQAKDLLTRMQVIVGLGTPMPQPKSEVACCWENLLDLGAAISEGSEGAAREAISRVLAREEAAL